MEVKSAIQAPTVYFVKPGPDNTDETLRLAKKRAEELGIKTILVATTKGDTGLKAVRLFQGYRVVCVTHATGFKDANVQEVPEETLAAIRAAGGIVYTGTGIFSSIGRAVRRKFQTYELEDLTASILRIFGEGMKVVCEIACMAADAGLVRTDEEVVSIAGSGRGADLAVVLQPANSFNFFDLRVKEIICKPRR